MNSQKRAIQNYRDRLSAEGWVRFEVLGRDSDKELIRALARKLGQGDEESIHLRGQIERSLQGKEAQTGGVLAALRRSPLVGEELNLQREQVQGRRVEL